MPEVSKAPRRWIITSIVIIILAMVAIGSAVYTVTLGQKSNKQQAEIIALKTRLQTADNLRAAELRAQKAAAVLEKRAAKLRSQSECRSGRKATALVTTIIEGLRATYLDLADKSINPVSAEALRQRAKALPAFPFPQCDPGPTQPRT